MSQLQLSFLLSLLCVGVLALAGRRPYVEEFHGRVRQTFAAFLLIGILALAVFYPVTSFGKAEEINPDDIWFPALLMGHYVLTAFLLLWWRLRRDVSLGAFLHLSWGRWWERIRRGIGVGGAGWVVTVTATGIAAGLFAMTGRLSTPTEMPPVIAWLAELPIMYKLIIVGVAMTVEEAFFRAYLQPRVGLVASSMLFAFSHFSYGLPFMIVGVFTISLIIGRTFERMDDLLPCIIAHGIFDGVQLLIVLPWAVHAWSGSAVVAGHSRLLEPHCLCRSVCTKASTTDDAISKLDRSKERTMRLVTFLCDGEPHIGAEGPRGLVDFSVVAPALPETMLALLADGAAALDEARRAAARAFTAGIDVIAPDQACYLAPLPRPGKIFGIGLNYRDHAEETGNRIPEVPMVFSKAATAVIGLGAPIEIPAASALIDYEGELAVVIGAPTKRVSRRDALQHVAGYTVMNDVTARDYQARSGHCMGKSFDTFAPMGPVLVTTDEIADPSGLDLRTIVSGEEMQRSNTRNLIFDVPALIEYISAGVTLEPGDVITTGTPAGVGYRRDPRRFLKPGDTVRVEISRIGALENPVIRAPA